MELQTSMEVGEMSGGDEGSSDSGSDEDEGAPTSQEPRASDFNSKLNERVARDILDLPARGDVTQARTSVASSRHWHSCCIPTRGQPTDWAKEVFQRINAARRYMMPIISGDLPSQ